MTRSGLLLPRPSERAAFYHLSFQEFLAAQRIARGGERRVTEVIDARCAVPEWRPTLLFLFAAQIFHMDPEWGLELLGRLVKTQDRAAVQANPAPAVLIAEALELCLAKGYQIPEALAESFRRLSLDAIEDEIEVRSRQALGLCLGRLGDPRIFDLRDARAYIEVPAGVYSYGKERRRVEIAAPFRLGRYPVTNSQYEAFLEDGGYRNRVWWSDAGWTWVENGRISEPSLWGDRRRNCPNQPVVGVSFWEAEACCAWAGGRLPREEEWEAAARGPKRCDYPWCGDWKNGICSSKEAGLGITSPVGIFPRSRQAPLRLEDLAGNAWEWCSNAVDDPDNTSPVEEKEAHRVLRGGSWYSGRRDVRCAGRIVFPANGRASDGGFRVVRSSSITGN